MSEKQIVGHVDALFGGQPVRFELLRDRDTVTKLEAAVGSPNAAWGRFLVGTWTVADVRAVLALAHPVSAEMERPTSPLARVMADAQRTLRRAAPTVASTPRGVAPEAIDAVLASRPIATYAALAAGVLQAFMVGLSASAATFDERVALDEIRGRLDAPAAPADGVAA